VRFVSPASPPDRDEVERGARIVESWGLRVELGRHIFERHGHYLAGRDEERLADLNDALRDPGVRAIFTTRGGKGSYRIAHALDFEAAARDPKPLIGYSDITILHLALWQRARVGGIHGPYPPNVGEGLRRMLMAPEALTVRRDDRELTSRVTIAGGATGTLMGGSLALLARSVGWACPNFSGCILLLEAIDMFIGQIDSALVQLRRSGCLEGVAGVAIGQFIRSAEAARGKWSALDVLSGTLGELGVPVLGGLPIGHGPTAVAVPLGTMATLDTATGTLTVEPFSTTPGPPAES
jgi:muramoyltetrapeptide carboxypeptidase